MTAATTPPAADRTALRRSLLEARERFVSASGAELARTALTEHLRAVLRQLEPASLGLYWSLQSEFNAVQALAGDMESASMAWALPFAQRSPTALHYRAWDRHPPPLKDECGIPSSAGAPLVPEVVLVPCLGYTTSGYRLGYGGGYYDRWLAEHRQITAVGVAWSVGAIGGDGFVPQDHDQALALIVTDAGVVS